VREAADTESKQVAEIGARKSSERASGGKLAGHSRHDDHFFPLLAAPLAT
jgi:hypothetical protein